jgi:hypothetical protein
MTKGAVDARLDEAEASSDPRGKLEAVNDIIALISEETDPLVRAELWVYADSAAPGRLDIRDASSLRALRDKFQAAVSASGPRGPGGPSPRHARVTTRDPGYLERAEMVGALIEHPDLLDDAEVRACLSLLEGPSARTVAALAASLRAPTTPSLARQARQQAGDETRVVTDEDALGHTLERQSATEGVVALQSPGQFPFDERTLQQAQDRAKERTNERKGPAQKTLDTGSFLAQIPPLIQAFASERLAAPHHETREDAKGHLLENARKLRTVILGRETRDLAREAYRAVGDWQAETDLAREAAERVKQKLGLGRGQE